MKLTLPPTARLVHVPVDQGEKDANGWPRSWANVSLLWLHPHWNTGISFGPS
jgi:hypothetical protein